MNLPIFILFITMFENQLTASQDPVESLSGSNEKNLLPIAPFEGRRRLPFMLPVMYNLGVITTLLTVLTTLMFKGLTIGIILLISNFSKHKYEETNKKQPIHVHLHPGGYFYKPKFPSYYDRSDATTWDKVSGEKESVGDAAAYPYEMI